MNYAVTALDRDAIAPAKNIHGLGQSRASAFAMGYVMGNVVPENTLTQKRLAARDNPARATFHRLAREWEQATFLQSSVTAMCTHEKYQNIIGLGPAAVPLILAELERSPNHWYWALGAITREDPAANVPAGDIRAICDAWVDWGRQTGARFAYAGFVS
jgi:hypothetical protein